MPKPPSRSADPAATGASARAAPRGGRLDIRLPNYWQGRKSLELGRCRPRPAARAEDGHNYVLVCLPFGRFVSKLHQPEVCTIGSDQDFFSLLRELYHQHKHKLPLLRLRRVKAIHFVQVS